MTMKEINISTGDQCDVQRVDGNAFSASLGLSWTSVTGTAPDGLSAFTPAHAKSTTKGYNSNTFLNRYVFGKKSTYTGYTHYTKLLSFEEQTRQP